jgi:Ras-related protein Rab-1A
MTTAASGSTGGIRYYGADPQSEFSALFKIVIVGDSGCGKSCLLSRYADDTFSETYIATIGVDFRIRTITRESGEVVKLQIWDTAGQDRFRSITTSYYHHASGVIVTYDTTSRETFKSLPRWLSELERYVKPTVTLILAGTKADMSSKREVDLEDVRTFAQQNSMKFVETSARTGAGVEELFNQLAEDLWTKSRLEKKKKDDTNKVVVGPGRAVPVENTCAC